MNNPQYIFSMYKLSKTYPGSKQVIKDISLSFLPGAKIGVLGGNGAGKSTLLKIMAGIDKDFNGEAKLADGIKIGYLAQEPELNNSLDVYENVMEGMSEAKKLVDAFNEISLKFSENLTDDEMNEKFHANWQQVMKEETDKFLLGLPNELEEKPSATFHHHGVGMKRAPINNDARLEHMAYKTAIANSLFKMNEKDEKGVYKKPKLRTEEEYVNYFMK